MAAMRAVRFHATGGPEVLVLDDVPRPEPGPGEILVRMGHAGVNFVDTYLRSGSYDPGTLPAIAGKEGAGRVDATGPGVNGIAAGDRAAFSAALPVYLETQLARVGRAADTYDFSSPTHALLGGLLAVRQGEVERARDVLEKTRAMSLESGYPEREALWQALDAELALAGQKMEPEELAARAEMLAGSRYLQSRVARLNLLASIEGSSVAAEAGKALCAARGQALSEWSFGFSSLVPNLVATRAACEAYPSVRQATRPRPAAD